MASVRYICGAGSIGTCCNSGCGRTEPLPDFLTCFDFLNLTRYFVAQLRLGFAVVVVRVTLEREPLGGIVVVVVR